MSDKVSEVAPPSVILVVLVTFEWLDRMSTADNGSHGAFPNPEAKNCYARNLVSEVAMIWFVCSRTCVFQLSTWFQEAGKVPL